MITWIGLWVALSVVVCMLILLTMSGCEAHETLASVDARVKCMGKIYTLRADVNGFPPPTA
jgi:hypothetical protein